jgi:hypothetical protein
VGHWQRSMSCPESILNILTLRSTAVPFLHSSRWQWIICPFRLLQYPLNVSFPQVPKPIPRSETKSAPLLMEMLQMLKFHLKKEHLNFTNAWITSEAHMLQDNPEEDLLHSLLQGSTTDEAQNGLDNIMRLIDFDND